MSLLNNAGHNGSRPRPRPRPRPRRRAAPLRVCHLGKYYPPAPGGIETHVRTLALAQARLGLDVTVLCVNHLNRAGRDTTWARYGQTLTEFDRDGDGDGDVEVIRIGRSATAARFDICPGLPRTVRQLNRRAFDIFHLHTPNPTMLLAVAALTGHGTPLVITHHSDIVRQRWLRWFLEPFERRVYVRAAAVLSSTESYASASALLARHAYKLEVVPMGLDLTPFLEPSPAVLAAERRVRDRFGDAPLWLAVGRCVYYKGYDIAIRALRQAPGRLIIVGQGPLEVELRALAQRAGVADRVVWWGYATQSELIGAYRAATALWFPSNARSESFGLVQVEAMASGCPVINTHIPDSGVTWVSRHGQTGLTVPMNSPAALAAASRRLVDEPGLRDALGAAARARARAEFEDDTMARRATDVYRRVLSRHDEVVTAPAPAKLSDWVRAAARVDAEPSYELVDGGAG
jgi:rhamnosyl/mannosyltransferase